MCLKQVQLMDVNSAKFKSALTKARKSIVDNVTNVGSLLDFLANDLNDDEKDNIQSQSTPKDKVRKLLDTLSYRVKLVPQLYLALKHEEEDVAAEALEKELPHLKEIRCSDCKCSLCYGYFIPTD